MRDNKTNNKSTMSIKNSRAYRRNMFKLYSFTSNHTAENEYIRIHVVSKKENTV